MNKTLLTISAMLISLNIFAQTNDVEKAIIKPSFSIEAGYSGQLLSKGVAYTGGYARYIGLNLHSPEENNFIPVDLYGSGTIITDNTDSFWSVGAGKSLSLNGSDKYALRLDGVFTTRRTDLNVPQNSELAGTVGLVTPWVMPYVSYTHDWRIEQNGLTFGLTKEYSLELKGDELFKFTPNISYHMFEDYKSVDIGARLALTKWQIQPFVAAKYIDNSFDVQNFNFAAAELDGDLVWSGGLAISF